MRLLKNNWSRSVFAVLSFLLALLMFWAGMTPGQQLTERPSRMLTAEEMRVLAGAEACEDAYGGGDARAGRS